MSPSKGRPLFSSTRGTIVGFDAIKDACEGATRIRPRDDAASLADRRYGNERYDAKRATRKLWPIRRRFRREICGDVAYALDADLRVRKGGSTVRRAHVEDCTGVRHVPRYMNLVPSPLTQIAGANCTIDAVGNRRRRYIGSRPDPRFLTRGFTGKKERSAGAPKTVYTQP